MYDSYIMKRTQIYLEETQDVHLGRRARATGVTKSTLIREAIEAYLTAPEEVTELDRFRAALKEIERKPVAFEDGASYVERIRRTDAERQAEIEQRRR